jgi:hypothetical protein
MHLRIFNLLIIFFLKIDGVGEVDKRGVHDIFDFEEANYHIHPSFYSYSGEPKNLEDQKSTNIFPGQGGIHSPYNRLKIIFEDISPEFELNTVEINNVYECNVIAMSARRLNGTSLEDLIPQDQFLLESFLLNNRAVIDFDYCKAFNSCPNLEWFEYLELNFEETRYGDTGACEIRTFGHRTL